MIYKLIVRYMSMFVLLLEVHMTWPWSKLAPPAAPPTWLEYATVVVEQNGASDLLLALVLGLCLCVATLLRMPSRDPAMERLLAAEKRRRAFRKNIVDITFRAMKSVAVADGVFHPKERELLAAVAESLTVVCPGAARCIFEPTHELACHIRPA